MFDQLLILNYDVELNKDRVHNLYVDLREFSSSSKRDRETEWVSGRESKHDRTNHVIFVNFTPFLTVAK